MPKMMNCQRVEPPTTFERNVLFELVNGFDPYRTLVEGGTRTRAAVTGALGRLVRKGYAQRVPLVVKFVSSSYGRDYIARLRKAAGL
jgi:hypothetical protein